jgi:hypothetical protein
MRSRPSRRSIGRWWSPRPVTAGLATFADLEGEVVVAASYWNEPLRSSAPGLTKAREAAHAASGGELVAESYEVVVASQAEVTPPGGVVFLARLRVEPARIADSVAFFRGEELAGLAAHAGLCSFELQVDRDFGTGLVVSAWQDRDAARGLREVIEGFHDKAGDEVGAKLLPIETYTMVRSSTRLVD